MTSRTDKQAARAYQREHPGTSYTRALKAVTETPAAGPLGEGLYLGYTMTGFGGPVPLVWRPERETDGHAPRTLGVYGWGEEDLDALLGYFYRDGLKGTSTFMLDSPLRVPFQEREHADLASDEEVLRWSRGQNLSDLKRRITQVDAVVVNLRAVNYDDPSDWLLVEALFNEIPFRAEEDEDGITVQGEHDLLRTVLESAGPGQLVIFSALDHTARAVDEGLEGEPARWGVDPEVFYDWCDVIICLNTMSEHEPPQVQRVGFPPVEYHPPESVSLRFCDLRRQ